MLVRVRMLRKKGQKLTAQQVHAGAWIEGLIRVQPEPARRLARADRLVAILVPEASTVDPLAQLFGARLLRMELRGFVLAGVEEIWDRKRGTDHPQTWWCVPVVRSVDVGGRAAMLSPQRIPQGRL
jgi:hypothetical protein